MVVAILCFMRRRRPAEIASAHVKRGSGYFVLHASKEISTVNITPSQHKCYI